MGHPDPDEELAALRTEMRALQRRGRWTLAVVVVLAIAAAVPAVVLASHDFSDVPTGSTYHQTISNIKAAGITVGCTPTTYCPDDPVTRGQMSAFLNRAAGRGGVFTDTGVSLGDTYGDIVSGTITTTGAGWILATASSMAYTDSTTGCACQIAMQLTDPTPTTSYFFGDELENATPTTRAYSALSNTYLFPVSTKGQHTVTVQMSRSGTANVFADAALTLVWVPFGPSGGGYSGVPPKAGPVQGARR